MIFEHHQEKKVEIKEQKDVEINKDQYFHLDDGRSIKSINELYEIIDSINDDEFLKHHINNNFGKWIRGVFNDHDLYHKLLWAKNKEEYKLILKEKLEPKNDVVKNDVVKNDVVKNDVIKDDNTNKTKLNKEEIKETLLKNEALKQELIKQEEIKQAEITKKINLLEREAINADKDRIDEEKALFNDLNYDTLLNTAEQEIKNKHYEDALINLESAIKLKQEKEVLEKIDKIKAELLKITQKKKNDDFLKETENKSFASQIELFNSKFNNFKDRIKILRKEGKDPYIADLHLMPFKSKVMIAEVTREQKDLDVIKELIMIVQKELDEVESEKIKDLKTEINEGAKALIDEDIKKQIMV